MLRFFKISDGNGAKQVLVLSGFIFLYLTFSLILACYGTLEWNYDCSLFSVDSSRYLPLKLQEIAEITRTSFYIVESVKFLYREIYD